MLVKDYMLKHPIMIQPHRPVLDAQQLMAENKIRHLPVVGDGKRLLGLVTRQQLSISPERLGSLNVWEISRYLSDLTVEKVMARGKDLHTISPDATLEDAADRMIRNKIDGLIVTEDKIVVGVLTETDLLTEFCNLLGENDPGWRVTMRAPDETGEFAKLSETVAQNGWVIMAMGNVRSPKVPHHWDIVLKIHGCTREELVPVLENIEGQQVIDVRQTHPASTGEILSLPAKRGGR